MMRRIFLIFPVLAVCTLFFFVQGADAATFIFSPSTGTYAVGKTFSVDILASSSDQAVNAFSGDVSYSSDKLSVTSVSKTGSIVNFWTVDPSFGNGTVHYEGVALNPGYTGTHGEIVRVTFRALAEGAATLKFNSASILANDGQGTSVISSTGTASFTLVPGAAPAPAPEPAVSANLPSLPIITSSTHPDQLAWYSVRVAQLSWSLPSDVSSVYYTTNARTADVPANAFGLAKGRATPTLADGVWYTHVQFKNAAGRGPVADFKTQIDGTPPTSVSAKDISDADSVTGTLALSASDALSGIAKFGVSVDGGPETFVPAAGPVTNYASEALGTGTHKFVVKAYDRAGNAASTDGSFEITKLMPPTITDYQKTLRDQDFLVVRGATYPNTKVEFSLVRELPVRDSLLGPMVYVIAGTTLTAETTSDASGVFTFAYQDRLPHGLYKITARAVMEDGQKSGPSDEISVSVTQGFFVHILSFLLDPNALLVFLLILLMIAIFFIIRLERRYQKLEAKTAALMRRDNPKVSD